MHIDVHIGLWNNIQLVAGDRPIPIFTACSLLCFTGTVHTITASLLESPLALESLLESLLEACLIACLIACLGESSLRKPPLKEPSLRELRLREPLFGRSRLFHVKRLADGKLRVCRSFG